MIMADVNEGSLKEMEALVGEGVTSFKLFMAYPGVLLQRRRPDPARHAEGRRDRRADHDARRERHRDRRARRAGARPRRRPTRATTAIVRHELLEAEATHRAIKLAQVAGRARSTSCTCRRRRRSRRSRRRATRATTPSPRPARSTCSCPPTTSPGPGFEGAKYVCSTPLRPARAPGGAVAGAAHRTTCRWSPPTTARSASRGRRRWGCGDFSKIPNGLPGVEHRMDLLHQGVVDGHISRRRWIEIACATPGPDVRALPAQGHDRAGRRRRRRHLRPERDAGALGGDAPHERRLLLLRGQARSPAGSRRCSPAGGSSSTAASTPGAAGPRAVPAPRHVPVPALAKEPTWTSGSSCRPTRPASAVVDLMVRAEELGFSHGWTFDSHVLWQEPYVIYSQVLARTSRLVVGPMVTNPGTRDWTVIASPARHAERDVRQPHGLRHRPRRLRDARAGPQAHHPGPARRARCTSSASWPRAGRSTSTARRSGSRGCRTARSCRCGWPGTGRRRWS